MDPGGDVLLSAPPLLDELPLQPYAEAMAREDEFCYSSPIRIDANRSRSAAVDCSDGRFGEQIDNLLHDQLKLPRYDRLAIPGGAACLAGHFNAYREEEGVAERLRFLIGVHGFRRVVLIPHQDCAYYTGWLRIAPLQLEARQREDLRKAIRHVKRLGSGVEVLAFFARRRGGCVNFERVAI